MISLAPSPRLAATVVARRVTDPKFDNAPANYRVFPAASVGELNGSELLTLNFSGPTKVTGIKLSNRDFAIQPGGTCMAGASYRGGDSCSLVVRFTPQGPGKRLGFLKISNSTELQPAFVGLLGNGYAPVVSFTPSIITTVPATVSGGVGIINNATNLAIGGDTLYIADVAANKIRQIDSSGVDTDISPVFAVAQSVAVDSSGFVYSANVKGSTYYFSFYTPWGTQTAYGTTHTAGSCTPSTPCPLTSVGLSNPANIAIDPYDNLFMEDATKGAIEMPVGSLAGGTGNLDLWYLTNQLVYASGNPAPFGIDNNDNLYNFYNYSYGTATCYLQGEPLYNAEYSPISKRVAGGVKCGFSGDGGQARTAEISNSIGQITTDIAGNIYFVDAGNLRVRRIDATTGVIRTIAGNGNAGNTGDNGPATIATLRTPSGLTVDSQGQVYVLSNSSSTGTAQVVRKLGVTGGLTFPSTAQGTQSITLQVNVANTGNSTLTFTRTSITGTNHTEFTIDNDVTNLQPGSGGNSGCGSKLPDRIHLHAGRYGIKNGHGEPDR